MLVLGIESSSPVASVALVSEAGLKSEITLNIGLTHAEQLLPLIDELLKRSRVLPGELEGIAISGGPGSFTGLRIGMATAKGLAQGLNIPLVSVPTLRALVFTSAGTQGLVSPMMNARKQEIYTALFRFSAGKYEQIIEDCAIAPAIWAETLLSYEEPVLLTGDGAQVYAAVWAEKMPACAVVASPVLSLARAATVASLGREDLLAGRACSLNELKPFYIRLAEAETRQLRCK